jgi:hypothetical protein
MSTIKTPIGRKPKQVYWRRRAIALLALIAVIIAIVLVIVRPGSGDAATNGSAADASLSAGTADAAGAAVPEPGTVEVPAATAEDGAIVACVPADIAITPQTDTTTYPAGSLPQLSFSLTNKSGAACSLDVGTATQSYTVTSGSETYWVSTDCQTGASNTPTVISAGATLSSTPISWDRTRSATDTCSTENRTPVPAGGASYHLGVGVGGFTSAGTTQFILN